MFRHDKEPHMPNRNSAHTVLHSWHSQKGFFHMDPLLHITVWCAGLNCSELAETIKHSITVGTRSHDVPHTVTGFIIFCQTGRAWQWKNCFGFFLPQVFVISLTNEQTGHFFFWKMFSKAILSLLSSFLAITGGVDYRNTEVQNSPATWNLSK